MMEGIPDRGPSMQSPENQGETPSRAKALFLSALDRTPEDRAAFLDEACAEDAGLRERVEALLGAHAAGDSLGPVQAGPGVLDDLHPGDQVGNYRLVRELGQGGFGRVFLAEQLQPVRRHVAFKVIKLGMDTRQFIARFEAERQTLSSASSRRPRSQLSTSSSIT